MVLIFLLNNIIFKSENKFKLIFIDFKFIDSINDFELFLVNVLEKLNCSVVIIVIVIVFIIVIYF